MILKRRVLKSGQKVLIIYDTTVGPTCYEATFKEYRLTHVNNVNHQIPVFICDKNEITGLECFWVLHDKSLSPNKIERLQQELISLQLKTLEISQLEGYPPYIKVKDKEIEQMAQENIDRLKNLIKKLGFDPRDDKWIESELTDNIREKNWFAFERENALIFTEEWDSMTRLFNDKYGDSITSAEAKDLSKKRMRYLLGSYFTRMSGNANKEDWKQAAKTFEQEHRDRENRMLTWTIGKAGKFPLVRTKKPILFFAGPYFNRIIEKVPHLFTDTNITYVKPGIIIRVLSYDPVSKYIRLDFTSDIRIIIKGNDVDPWIKDSADYDLWLKPEEIETHLEIIDQL